MKKLKGGAQTYFLKNYKSTYLYKTCCLSNWQRG